VFCWFVMGVVSFWVVSGGVLLMFIMLFIGFEVVR